MKQYEYGYAEIAEAAGKKSGAVRVDVARDRLDPENLLSVSLYVVAGRIEKERKNGSGIST